MSDPASSVTADQILRLLEEDQILEDVAELTPDSDLFVAGLDSMALMQLLLHIEQTFGASLQPGEITRERFQSASTLADYLNQRRPQSA